jgi:hypothetical protein
LLIVITLGAFTFCAVHAVSHALRDVLQLTTIHEQPAKAICAISQETEDALDARSLATLAESHDRQTREAAIRILCDRFVHDPRAVTALTGDLCSPASEKRAKADTLLKMLQKFSSDQGAIQFLLNKQASAFHNSEIVHFTEATGPSVLREVDDSFEEQEVRRRRREAVVLHDGDGPVRQDDIIQRGSNGVPVQTSRTAAETSSVEEALREITARGNA